MKRQLGAVLLTLTVASPAFADKPEWAGKGKPTAEQKEARSAAIESRKGMQQDMDEHWEKLKKEKTKKEKQGDGSTYDGHDSDHDSDHDELKGLEKQKVMKSEQEQKELGRGSEQGQEARQGRRKWWKFWGE